MGKFVLQNNDINNNDNGPIYSKKEKNSINLAFVIPLLLGLLLIGIGIFINKRNQELEQNAWKTMAKIVRIESSYSSDDEDHNVFVEFEVDNNTYGGELDYYDSSMYEGKEVEIYFDKNNPNDFKSVEGSKIFVILFLVMGGFFVIISIVLKFIIKQKSIHF